jgi:glycosyltransferase 2 family protein
MIQVRQIFSRCKPFLRWLIFGATLFFIGTTLHQHWNEVQALRVTGFGWSFLGLALSLTLIAHIWTGWVWSWILRGLGQPAGGIWAILVYLKTNIAKYLPGNVWHFYGRVMASKQKGFAVEAATLSVLLEPLLMAAAALMLALVNANQNWPLQALCLAGVLLSIHPRVLNPLLKLAGRLKGNSKTGDPKPRISPPQVKHYPWMPLLGEIGFVALRGAGFILTLQALQAVTLSQIPLLLSAFSIAWVLGLVIPGAPGGTGVFEATAIALLSSAFPVGSILGSVALYRLISILAEALGAGLAFGVAKLKRR